MPAVGGLITSLSKKLKLKDKEKQVYPTWPEIIEKLQKGTIEMHCDDRCLRHTEKWAKEALKCDREDVKIVLAEVFTCSAFTEQEREFWTRTKGILSVSQPENYLRLLEFALREAKASASVMRRESREGSVASSQESTVANASTPPTLARANTLPTQRTRSPKMYPSVLDVSQPQQDRPDMGFPEAIGFISGFLSDHVGRSPPNRPVSVVLYSPIGSPIHVNEDLILHNYLSLQHLISHFAGLLDESYIQELMMVLMIEIRMGTKEVATGFPSIMGTPVGMDDTLLAAETVTWDLQDGMSYPELYWASIRSLMQFGGMNSWAKPILKVRTLYQIEKTGGSDPLKAPTLVMKIPPEYAFTNPLNGKSSNAMEAMASVMQQRGSRNPYKLYHCISRSRFPNPAAVTSPLPLATLGAPAPRSNSPPAGELDFKSPFDFNASRPYGIGRGRAVKTTHAKDPNIFRVSQSPVITVTAVENPHPPRKVLHSERNAPRSRRRAPKVQHHRDRGPFEEDPPRTVPGDQTPLKRPSYDLVDSSVSEKPKNEKVINIVLRDPSPEGNLIILNSKQEAVGEKNKVVKPKKEKAINMVLRYSSPEEDLINLSPKQETSGEKNEIADLEKGADIKGKPARPFTGAEKQFTPGVKLEQTQLGFFSNPGLPISYNTTNPFFTSKIDFNNTTLGSTRFTPSAKWNPTQPGFFSKSRSQISYSTANPFFTPKVGFSNTTTGSMQYPQNVLAVTGEQGFLNQSRALSTDSLDTAQFKMFGLSIDSDTPSRNATQEQDASLSGLTARLRTGGVASGQMYTSEQNLSMQSHQYSQEGRQSVQGQHGDYNWRKVIAHQVFTPEFDEEGRVEFERVQEIERQQELQRQQDEIEWRARAVEDFEKARGFDGELLEVFFPAANKM